MDKTAYRKKNVDGKLHKLCVLGVGGHRHFTLDVHTHAQG